MRMVDSRVRMLSLGWIWICKLLGSFSSINRERVSFFLIAFVILYKWERLMPL